MLNSSTNSAVKAPFIGLLTAQIPRVRGAGIVGNEFKSDFFFCFRKKTYHLALFPLLYDLL